MTGSKPLLSVEDALARAVAGLAPKGAEQVPLVLAVGRVLAADLAPDRDQPPTATSAMDGYAVRASDVGTLPVTLRQIGTAPAGHPFVGKVGPGETVRIFTGGAMPDGADAIVIQENVDAKDDRVTVVEGAAETRYVRAKGLDFAAGIVQLEAGTRLAPRHVALAAAMNRSEIPVWRKPRIGILATGDELAVPGAAREGEIATSNSYGLLTLVEAAGGTGVNLGIARDTRTALAEAFASATGLDLLVTIGGASVGEHDLVRETLGDHDLDLDFWRVAMKPGKPLMHGSIRGTDGSVTRFLGLPGNPVSSLVCGQIFLLPMLRALSGETSTAPRMLRARLGAPLQRNGDRQEYMRATLTDTADGLVATPFAKQDSSMLATLARADGFIIRAPGAAALAEGDEIEFLPIAF